MNELILLVDDEPLIVQQARDYLEHGGFRVLSAGDGKQALFDEDGTLEVDKGSFTIAPFLFTDGRLLTWADVEPVQDLANGYLPIPSVRWEHEHFWLAITVFAARRASRPCTPAIGWKT